MIIYETEPNSPPFKGGEDREQLASLIARRSGVVETILFENLKSLQ